MSAEIRDILATEEEQEVVRIALQQYINRCKAIAKSPIVGEKCGEKEKRQAWGEKADLAEQVLNSIMNELI